MTEVTDFLKGFTPEINEDGSGFEILEGTYKTKVNYLRPDKNKDGAYDRYRLELEVTEVLKGNGNPGRKLWNTYYKDNEASVKKLANDLFTAGIQFDSASEAAFEGSFENAIGKAVFVRGWGWTPAKKMDGSAIAKEDQVARQSFVVKSEKDLQGGGKSSGKKSAGVPF